MVKYFLFVKMEIIYAYDVSLDLTFKDTKYAKLFHELLKHNNVRIVLESRKNK